MSAQFRLRTVVRSFFDRDVVMRAMDSQTRQTLSRFGAYVARRAKSLIRPARQLPLGEMSADELLQYRIAQAAAKRAGRAAPKRPLASSKPGEPPRSILGYLRRFIYFGWDPATHSVVIGPALFGGASGTAPRVLEEGGMTVNYKGKTLTIKPRPFMSPAFQAELVELPKIWQQSVSSFSGAAA